jgi:ABC-type lipoprotein release transport system permease subunit
MNLLRLAWRNLWRNKRRTLITAASVFFAVLFALWMRSLQLGSYDLMVNNIVHAWSGYFQVHAKGYWDEQTLENSFEKTKEMDSLIHEVPGLTDFASRLESFALASYGMQTKGVMVTGIDPDQEDQLTSLRKKMTKGSYLKKDETGALIGQRLSRSLKIGIGDTLVLIGQGYQGVSAAGIFPVTGIIRFPSPELDNRMVFLSLSQAQTLFNADSRLTSLAFNVSNPDDYPNLAAGLKKILNPAHYEVMTWKEMMPEVVQQIQADNASGLIMLAILYMVVGFGIFGTMLMMFNERIREFGMMVAIGMQKTRLMLIVILEMALLGLLGIVTGVAVATPFIYYYYINPIPLTGEIAESTLQMGFEPIMPTAWKLSYFINQSITVAVIILIVMILPVVRISRMKIIDALKHS